MQGIPSGGRCVKRKLPIFSIRVSLVLVALFAIIPALVILTVTGRDYATDRMTNIQEQQLQKTVLLGEVQNTITQSTRKLLATFARMPEFRTGNISQMTVTLQRILAVNPE